MASAGSNTTDGKPGADLDWQTPDWPAPDNIGARVTGRTGGVSLPPYDSFNLGTHVGDVAATVARNRRALRRALPGLHRLQWLNQVHGTRVVSVAAGSQGLRRRQADAACLSQPGDGVAVLTADCLPVLLCSHDGRVAAAAHAGWRGLLNGVLENTVRATQYPGTDLMAWLGPAIGPCCFEVGAEVRSAFMAAGTSSAGAMAAAFKPVAGSHDSRGQNKSMMDIYAAARQRLQMLGVTAIYGGDQCTVCSASRFFSYRRDGVTGRMASLIYLKDG
ncbi:peptidoglycan editing factor PgeF [Pseudohongiella acticola]|jgi:purine-nucleoside/S-methyl-5'-thioadenosine phosphorylase / adenosine deaminase|uniref:peptidoglycan editing factor PgeF n=1 Tax=Pseudohongiella acticola TaxID=1524254 RepID=UPI0030EB8C2C